MVANSRVQNLDSYHMTLVSSFEHRRRPTVIHGECRGFIGAAHNVGRFGDIFVIVTQSI